MITIRFVKTEYSEVLNCVLLGVAAQHVKTIVNGNNSYKTIEGGFGCRGRFALGTLFGITALVIGERFQRKNWHILFQVLMRSGLASFYLCIFFSFQVYYLSTQTVSMVLAIFVTGMAALMAVAHAAMSIALLALIVLNAVFSFFCYYQVLFSDYRYLMGFVALAQASFVLFFVF